MKRTRINRDTHLRIIIDKLKDFFSCEVNLEMDIKKINSQDIISFTLKHNKEDIVINFIRKDINKSKDKQIYNQIIELINDNCDSNLFKDYDDNFFKYFIANRLESINNTSTKILFAIDYFDKLRTTSFEGRYFSTAMILTSLAKIEKYKNIYLEYGDETLVGINNFISLYDKIDRRFWYLIDGRNSFYVSNEFLKIRRVLTLDDSKGKSFIDNHMLSGRLQKNDILFRINNEKEFSVISNKEEFTYIENKWKYRNYNYIESIFNEHTTLDSDCITSLLFFIFYCSRNSISSIIWIPKDLSLIESDENSKCILKSKNSFFNTNSQAKIKIDNKKYSSTIKRIISSDGVTVFDNDGILRYYGCVVNIDNANINGLVGTGETATKILATNGLAIKISQDSTIKVFLDENNKIEI